MGFFGKIFGEKKPKRVSIPLQEVDQFLERELGQRRKELEQESAKKAAEIKHFLREASSSLEALEKAQSSAKSARLEKIVGTAKSNALRQVSSLLEKLSPPSTPDLAAMRDYANESIAAMQQASQFWKSVAYAGISFKEEIKAIGESMKHLSSDFVSLQKMLEKNKAVFLQAEAKGKVAELASLEKSLALAEKEIEKLASKLNETAAERKALSSKLSFLEEGGEFKSIGSLNEKKAGLLREKQSAKTELLDMFAKVEKPLHRLDKAVKSRKVFLPANQAAFLEHLLLNPSLALRKDPKAETVKQVLLEAKKAVESGLIELKERERQKKLDTLQEMISFDFFSESFWKFNKIDSQLNAIEKQLQEMPAIKQQSQMLAGLKQLAARAGGEKSLLESKRAELLGLQKSIQEKRFDLQMALSNATGKMVSLKG